MLSITVDDRDEIRWSIMLFFIDAVSELSDTLSKGRINKVLPKIFSKAIQG